MKRVINKRRIFYVIMIILMIGIVITCGVKLFMDFRGPKEKETITKNKLDALEEYGYTLDDLDTPLYKEYFEELKGVLNSEEIDYSKYASSISKLFITDFYTLSNKLTSSDIGGEEFVHKNIVDNFKMNAGDTIYNHVKSNVYGDRVQDLPTVSSVTINSVEETNYNEYSAYKVNVSWEYEVDMGYEKAGVLYLVKDDNKLYVVEKTGE